MKTKPFAVLLALSLVVPSLCLAGAMGIPQTGQTTSYLAGDDGALQAGVPWPDPRFVDNGDGTMTDNLTGLMWMKDANLGEVFELGSPCIPDIFCPGLVKWQDALDFVQGANNGTNDLSVCVDYTANYTDWRLPNIRELNSIVNLEVVDQAGFLDSQGFNRPSTYGYWSSTSQGEEPTWPTTNAWALAKDGKLQFSGKTSGTYSIWMVRNSGLPMLAVAQTGLSKCYDNLGMIRDCAGTGEDREFQSGVPSPDPRFTDNGDGTVTDNLTGLMWLKDLTGLGDDEWAPVLAKVADLNANPNNYRGLSGYTASYDDWRLPNRGEILSMVDYSEPSTNPTSILPLGHPFVNVVTGGLHYWTSTSSAVLDPANRAWSMDLKFGVASDNNKEQDAYIWPVRGQSIPPEPPKPGDMDGDGFLTLKDAAMGMRAVVGLPPGPVKDPALADADMDGKLGLGDVLAILRGIALGD